MANLQSVLHCGHKQIRSDANRQSGPGLDQIPVLVQIGNALALRPPVASLIRVMRAWSHSKANDTQQWMPFVSSRVNLVDELALPAVVAAVETHDQSRQIGQFGLVLFQGKGSNLLNLAFDNDICEFIIQAC